MTPGNESDEDPLGSAARISRAAEREAARDRRVLRIYIALSVIPVILAVAFLLYGRTDRTLIEDELAPVKNRIEEVQPALREVKELGTLASEVRALGDVAGEVRGTLSKIEEQSRQLQRIQDTTATVVVSREEDSRKLEANLAALRTQLATLKDEQATIQRNQVRIQSNVSEMLKRRPEADPNIQNLIKRLKSLEGRIAPVERDLKEIRKRQPGG